MSKKKPTLAEIQANPVLKALWMEEMEERERRVARCRVMRPRVALPVNMLRSP